MKLSIRSKLFFLIAFSVIFVILTSMIIIFLNFKNILLQQAVEDQKGIILKGTSDFDNIVYELDRITLYLCGDISIPKLLESSLEEDIDKLNFAKKLHSSVLTYTNYPITRASIDYHTMLFVTDSLSTAKHLNSYKLDKYLTSNSRIKTVVSNSNAVENEDWYKKQLNIIQESIVLYWIM